MLLRAVGMLHQSIRRRKDMEITEFYNSVRRLLEDIEEWEEEYGGKG